MRGETGLTDRFGFLGPYEKDKAYLSQTTPAENDIAGDTTSRAAVEVGTQVAGTIDFEQDRDWFRLELAEGQRISVAVATDDANRSFEAILRREDGTTVGVDPAAFIAPADEVYFIDVGANGSFTGAYALLVETLDVPDDNRTDVVLDPGETIAGYLDFAGDRDRYAMWLGEGEGVTISLTRSGTIDIEDPFLAVFSGNGDMLAWNDDYIGLDSQLRFEAPVAGYYYIEASALTDAYMGSYRLGSVQTSAPTEPRTVADEATFAQQLVEGYWHYLGEDQRAFDVSTSRTVTFDVSWLDEANARLAIEALGLWGDATGLDFVPQVGGAQIVFDTIEQGSGTEFALSGNTIVSAHVYITPSAVDGMQAGSGALHRYLHEVGHALGFGHAGNYGDRTGDGQHGNFLNDSWAMSVMSGFDQSHTVDIGEEGLSIIRPASPMFADLAAANLLYPHQSAVRTGDTVYGFGSTSDRTSHNAALCPQAALTILDDGGVDTLDYSGFAFDQRIDLTPGARSNVGGLIGNLAIAEGTVIENAATGAGADHLVGNTGANRLFGGGGADLMEGREGDDRLFGQAGDDRILGGEGADIVQGQAGRDVLFGEGGSDTLRGGGNYDELSGGSGADLLYGNNGNDTLDGDADADRLFGGAGRDVLRGGEGDDHLFGGDHRDWLFGELGSDTLQGGDGDDELDGGDGADLLLGQIGDDVLLGGNQSDILDGGVGDDRLFGGDGDDLLKGGYGNDWLEGGAGVDRFVFTAFGYPQADTVADFGEGDTIWLDSRRFNLTTGELAPEMFALGSVATTESHRIVYDATTGQLWFDSDGSGSGAMRPIATFRDAPELTVEDVFVGDGRLDGNTIAADAAFVKVSDDLTNSILF